LEFMSCPFGRFYLFRELPYMELEKSLPIEVRTLKNGLKAVVQHNPSSPVVCIYLSYLVGSKDEPFNKTGSAHLFEHLMFEGSENVPKGEFDKICSGAGGTNNAYTTYDHTAYYMTLPANKLELGLWLESDRMNGFSISQKALDTQIQVVCEEIRQTVDEQPYGRWREKMLKKAFSDKCSYSWDVYGSAEHVESVTLEDCKEFFSGFYRPDNAALVVAGNAEPNETFELIEKYFGTIKVPERKMERNFFDEGYKTGGHIVEYEDFAPMPASFLSYHIPGFDSDDIFKAELIAYILGSGKSARLYDSLIYEKQLAAQTGAYADLRIDTSLLNFYIIGQNPESIPGDLADAVIEEIEKVKQDLVSEEEMEKAQNQLRTILAGELQYAGGIADLLSNQTLFWKDPTRVYTLLDKYKRVTLEQLREFTRKYLVKSNLTRVDVSPKNGR
jgi:zinc protease